MLSVICGVDFKESNDKFARSQSFNNLIKVKHEESLANSSHFKEIARLLSSQDTDPYESVKSYLSQAVEKGSAEELVELGVSSLQLFLQTNWLGPLELHMRELAKADQDQRLVYYLGAANVQEANATQERIRTALSLDGEALFPIIKFSHFILVAKILLIDLAEKLEPVSPFMNWWSLRVTFLYQQLFEERSATLTDLAYKYMEKLTKMFEAAADSETLANIKYNKTIIGFASISYYLEIGHVHYQVYNWTKGQESFKKALDLSGIEYELTGVYGRKTRYQQKDLAQLLLKINKQLEEANSVEEANEWEFSNKGLDTKLLPKDLALNDEVLLDKMKISNAQDEELLLKSLKTSQLEQLIFCCLLFDFQKNSPSGDALTNEEINVFIQHLLMSPSNWCVQYSALFTRTIIEVNSSRRIERSLMQLEALIDLFNMPDHGPEFKNRLQFFYSLTYPSFWQAKKQLGNYCNKLGMINTSLEIYLGLQIWEEVIKCYQVLDKREKAEALIRQQLAIKETAELYCSLGDVTRDVQHYHKAIDLSKGKSAKAYRMLAKHQFAKEQYLDAIVNFEKSLSINSMQYDAWFMLGSAAFRSEKWETAVRAFRSCCGLEPDNHETWNNLAASHIKLGQKDKAHTVFQEALKYDYENWKIWENFLWTSTDCGYFDDIIKAYNRLLDLKEKYVDLDVLKALAESVAKNHKDAYDVPIHKIKGKILKLFGRLSSLVVNNWKVYWYYGEVALHLSQVEENESKELVKVELNNDAAIKFFTQYQKALRNLYNQANWEVSLEGCDEMVSLASDILSRCMEYGGYLQTPQDFFGSFNLSIRSIVSKLKQKYQVDDNNNSDGKYVSLLYLKELNPKFIQLQQDYEMFLQKFFS